MASSFISYWNYGSRYCGIEYNATQDSGIDLSVLTAIKRRDEFEVEKTFQTATTQECAEKLSRNQHAFLCITSNQVLIKSTRSTGPTAKVVSSAFPNVDLNDFYFEILQSTSGSIVTLCRKEQVHQIIASFEEHKIEIIGFFLGFSSIQNLIPILDNTEIYFSSFKILINSKEIFSFERVANENKNLGYPIGDTEISSKFLLPLSALFNYGVADTRIESNCETKNLELKKGHHQKVFFRKGLATAVGVLLVMLLINFLLFSNYYSELQEMTGRYELEIYQKKAYIEKASEIFEKGKIVDNILNNSDSRSSFYLNRLMVGKPASVLLNQFTYQPLQKQIKENELINLEENIIQLRGESINEDDFSQWIKDLEERTWITEVTVNDFGYNSPGTSEFLLTLKLNEDEAVN